MSREDTHRSSNVDSVLVSDRGMILSSGVYDESVFQEGKSQESIGHSRSVFSTPTIPTGNQVTRSFNKPHDPISFNNNSETIIHLRCYLTFDPTKECFFSEQDRPRQCALSNKS